MEVEPLRHVEAQKGVEMMRLGTNLMKHSTQGFPHLRFYQLSEDLRRLIWFSQSKSIDKSYIDMAKVV